MSEISLQGLVATTPRYLVTQEGLHIASFRLASPSSNGETTDWFTVTSLGALAENVRDSIAKGDRVFLYGDLRIRDWDNGERAGTTAEVEATAMGHDLNFGTSKFERLNTLGINQEHTCSCSKCDR